LFIWTPTGRLSLDASVLRTFISYTPDAQTSPGQTSYLVNDTCGFAATWSVSENTSLNMYLFRPISDYRWSVAPAAGPLRHDVQKSARFGAEWRPRARI